MPEGTRAAFDAALGELRDRIDSLVGDNGRHAVSDELHPSDLELSVEPETGTGQLRLDLVRRLAAEAFGTGMLIVAVIGSGIMASRLSTGDVGLQLLENAAATAARWSG